MQRFELLGGRYQQGEQILPGVIQSFRGYELPTGRPVFIHRIPSKEAVARDLASLLSAGLIQSAVVRKMVLDVYESEPYRFVVTEPGRQCVPLRDWLEREAGDLPEAARSAPATAVALPVEPDVVTEPVEVAEVEETRVSPEVDATEFARMFRAALAGKLERERRDALLNAPAIGYGPTGEPAPDEEVLDGEPLDEDELEEDGLEEEGGPERRGESVETAEAAAPLPSTTPQLFSQIGETPKAARPKLIVFLVVLAVLVVLLVMFVVVFVKR